MAFLTGISHLLGIFILDFFQFRLKYFGSNLSQTGKSHFYSVIRKTALGCCGKETV